MIAWNIYLYLATVQDPCNQHDNLKYYHFNYHWKALIIIIIIIIIIVVIIIIM